MQSGVLINQNKYKTYEFVEGDQTIVEPIQQGVVSSTDPGHDEILRVFPHGKANATRHKRCKRPKATHKPRSSWSRRGASH